MPTIHRPHFAVAAVPMLWLTRLITRLVDLTGAVGLTTVTTVHPSASMVAITVLAAAASATTDSAAKLPFRPDAKRTQSAVVALSRPTALFFFCGTNRLSHQISRFGISYSPLSLFCGTLHPVTPGADMDDSFSLDKVARELDSQDASNSYDPTLTVLLDRWLAALVNRRGSDLLLVEGAPPCVRVDGEVRKIAPDVLDGAEIEAAVLPALSSHALSRFRESGIADSSYRIEGLGRFRINLHRERSRAAAAIRALPSRVPSLRELHLPPT